MSFAEEVAPCADGLTQLRALIAPGRKPGISSARESIFERARLAGPLPVITARTVTQ